MAEPFLTTRRVDFCDTDLAGIVHFSNYFRYMERAEVDLLRSVGLSVAMLGDDGEKLGMPRVSVSCEYLQPARFDEVLDLAVSIEQMGRRSIGWYHEVRRDGQLLAKGRVRAVCCRWSPEGKLESVDLPPLVRAKLEAFVVPPPVAASS